MKKIIAMVMTTIMMFSMVACGNTSSEESSEELTTVRIALPTWVGYGSLYVAQEKGFFEENGLNVELTIVEGLAERKQAMVSGELEGLATAVDVFVNLESVGIEMDMVWLLDRSNGADGIVATTDVESPADLAGLTVATEIGTTEHFFLLKVLEQYGLTTDDIELVPLTIADSGAAFVAGQVDAAVTYDPYLSQGVDAGGVTFTTAEYEIDLMDAIGFSDEFIESNPEAIQGFVNAMSEATDYVENNLDECVVIEAEGLSLGEEEVAETLEKLECFDLAANLEQMGTTEGGEGKLYTSVAEIAEFYYEEDLNENLIEADKIINTTFIENVTE